jgi:predicted nucleic acid-binding protein
MTNLICVDANMVIRLIANPADRRVRQLWEQWDEQGQPLAAPALLYYEVTNALYRYQKLERLSVSVIQQALQAALALPIRLYGEYDLHQQALLMAARFALPAAYDAHYLAVAEWLGGEFWTTDGRLARVVQPALPWVHLVESP